MPHLISRMAKSHPEWLVTDQRGAFAMGSREISRERKYHGFYATIAGRGETLHWADMEISCNGLGLWPHCYSSAVGPVLHPDPSRNGVAPQFELTRAGPCWRWALSDGLLAFRVEARKPGGIALVWKWRPHGASAKLPMQLVVKPLLAMRPLHGVGGQTWTHAPIEGTPGLARITAASGQTLFWRTSGPMA